MTIKPGKHQVELAFFPQTVKRTETIAYLAYGLLLLLVVGAIGLEVKKRKEKK